MRCTHLWAFLLPVVVGCGGSPAQPIPIRGAPADIAAIAGEWDGTYESDDGMRRGSIDFHLRTVGDTAFGEAVIIPQDWGRPLQARDDRHGEPPYIGQPPSLVIRFVNVEGGEVSGEVESYLDPFCDCRKVTEFRGRLKGNTLKGRYRAYRQQGGMPDTGEWRVQRKPATP